MRKTIERAERKAIIKLLSLGSGKECPICGWCGYCFLPAGMPPKRRFDAQCPSCGSFERHRLSFLAAKQVLPLGSLHTLHVAPESSIGPWLQSESSTYISIDLHRRAMKKMDLRQLEFDNGIFSLIWCSHVLEHIVEDNIAIREIFRVCRPGGIALIQVPIWRQQTYENPTVESDEARLDHYYQKDHIRLYGLDIVDRFEEAGFSSKILRAQDFGPKIVFKHSLSFISTNEVFIFTKGQ